MWTFLFLNVPRAPRQHFILAYLLFSCKVMSNSFVTPWTVACQAPLSMGFSRQQYWSGLPCPPSGDLPSPGTELCLHISCVVRRRDQVQPSRSREAGFCIWLRAWRMFGCRYAAVRDGEGSKKFKETRVEPTSREWAWHCEVMGTWWGNLESAPEVSLVAMSWL